MPGTPVLRYGDEIGMGEDLALPERDAIRTPMQWSSTGERGLLRRGGGPADPPRGRDATAFGFQDVNVTDQRLTPTRCSAWFERILHTLRECDEIGSGAHRVIDGTPPAVLAHVAEGPTGVGALRPQPLRGGAPRRHPDRRAQRGPAPR